MFDVQAISSQTAAKVWLDQGRLVATEDLGPDRCRRCTRALQCVTRFLAQYTGEVITRLEMEARLAATYRCWDTAILEYVEPVMEARTTASVRAWLQCRVPRPGQKLHVFPLGEEAVVDSTTRGSLARLAVHSCRCSTGHTAVHEARN